MNMNQGENAGFARRPLCFYGDDFTGSTDVLEALFRAGLKTALFLQPPTGEQLAGRFAGMDAFGVAGVGRSLTPEEMEAELRPIFETLRSAGASVVHYKVCSTFDSSPQIGSIGRAAEIGREVFGGGRFSPLIVGVPYLRRYTLFGHHFAAGGDGAVHRLDRHPTMSRHPVTPMSEADLRVHLGRQTSMRMALMDIVELDGPAAAVRDRLERKLAAERPELVLFDVLDDERLLTAGRLIWEEAAGLEPGQSLFAVGSSGIEYALGAHWQASGALAAADGRESVAAQEAGDAGRLLVVSGSCSPVTEAQIGRALEDGFAGIRVPVRELLREDTADAARERLLSEAKRELAAGRSVVLYSASGPEDATIGELREAMKALGMRPEQSGRLLGATLGSLARRLVVEAGLTRLLIAGGDTSGYVTRELGILALECISALAPGGPLCRAYSDDAAVDGIELVLKGGQVGGEDFFGKVLRGR